MPTHDEWKRTNPDDEHLGPRGQPDPRTDKARGHEACVVCEREVSGPVQFYGCGHAAHVACDSEYEDQERCPECARESAPPAGAAPPGVRKCAGCGASLGKLSQRSLFGLPEFCLACERQRQVGPMLESLPEPADKEWNDLSEFEQEFIPSVRDQFARRGALSEKQLDVLERIHNKHGS